MEYHDLTPKPENNDRDMDIESVADQLLIDSLLKWKHKDTPKSIDQRVKQVSEGIDQMHRNYIITHWKSKLTVAAAVIIIGFIMVINSPPTVQADFAAVLNAFDTGDKIYKINISSQNGLDQDRNTRQAQHYSYRSPRRGNTTRNLDGAMLYIRQKCYVLKYRTSRGRGITKGFDGNKKWLINHFRRQSTLSKDPNSIPSDLPDYISSMMFLNLRDMLHKIEEQYILSEPILNPETDANQYIQYYVADRISQRGKMPKHVEIWFDTKVKQVQQIVFTELSFHSPRSPRHNLQIILESTESLSEKWFTPEMHLSQE